MFMERQQTELGLLSMHDTETAYGGSRSRLPSIDVHEAQGGPPAAVADEVAGPGAGGDVEMPTAGPPRLARRGSHTGSPGAATGEGLSQQGRTSSPRRKKQSHLVQR